MPFYQKEIMGETEEDKTNMDFSSLLKKAHRFGFTASCGLYFLSTFFALPFFLPQNSHFLISKQLLFNFAIVLAAAQSCQLVTKFKQITKYELITYMVTFCGCLALGIASVFQQTYNQGAKYMISSFLLSVSNQFKIIMLLLTKSRLSEQRNRFLCQLSCCCSSILFFFGAVIKESGLQIVYASQICPATNLLSGVLMFLSVFYMYRAQQDKRSDGYQGIVNFYEQQ